MRLLSRRMEDRGTSTWTPDQLDRIGTAGELRIAGVREDGTLRRPVIIWGVRIGDDFSVRSVNGTPAAWYRGTRARHEGWISSGGVEQDVAFEDIDAADSVQERIDAAYRTGYGAGSSAVAHIMSATARRATLEVVPC